MFMCIRVCVFNRETTNTFREVNFGEMLILKQPYFFTISHFIHILVCVCVSPLILRHIQLEFMEFAIHV